MKKNANLTAKGWNSHKAEGAKILQKDSDLLEQETKQMEQKLKEIQSLVCKEREKKVGDWGNASKDVPRKGYGKFVIEKATSNRKIVRDPKGETVIGIKTGKQIKTKNPAEKPAEAFLQEEEKSGLFSFLKDLALEKYFPLFKSKGCSDVQGLLIISEAQFAELGIPLGHKLKILKRARDLYPLPKTPVAPVPSGLQGIQKKEDARNTLKKSVRFEEKEVVIEARISKTSEVQIQTTEGSKKEPAEYCWNCYKRFELLSGYLDAKSNREYCSQSCFEGYIKSHSLECPACQKKFLKTEGQMERGIWFCSEACINSMIKPRANPAEDEEIDIDELLSL